MAVQAMTYACYLLYCVCRSLGCCVLPLLDVLVHSTTDKFSDDVVAKSRAALSRFSEQRLASGSRSLIESLEENVFNLATQLPNRISCPGDVVTVSYRYDIMLTDIIFRPFVIIRMFGQSVLLQRMWYSTLADIFPIEIEE